MELEDFGLLTWGEAGEGGSVGDPICQSGKRRGYRCGQITSTSTTINVANGPKLTDQKTNDICAGPGDSGGPVYYNRRAHGIISTSNMHVNLDGLYRCNDPYLTSYSGIYNIQQAFPIVVQTWEPVLSQRNGHVCAGNPVSTGEVLVIAVRPEWKESPWRKR